MARPLPCDADGVMTDEQLIALAREAALKAYAPYSGFHVGCAVESADGEVVTGANLENACYRLGLCAEQSALTAAQHMFGLHRIRRIAVAGGRVERGRLVGSAPVTPCGGCRQAIWEAACLAGAEIAVLSAGGEGELFERHTAAELLPSGFGPATLGGQTG